MLEEQPPQVAGEGLSTSFNQKARPSKKIKCTTGDFSHIQSIVEAASSVLRLHALSRVTRILAERAVSVLNGYTP